MSSKLVEAAEVAAAKAACEEWVSFDKHRPIPNYTRVAKASILAFLEAALEDEGVVEAIARQLHPRVWDVLDHEKDRMLRKYAGDNIAYPPAQYQDKATMTEARTALRALIQQVKS